MRFTCNLLNYYDPAKIIVTTPHPCSSELPDTLANVKIVWNVSNPCKSIIETKGDDHIPWKELRCVLWFVDNDEDNSNIRHHLIQSFKFLAIRILSEASYDLQVIVTMNNIRFAQLQVWIIYMIMLSLEFCIQLYDCFFSCSFFRFSLNIYFFSFIPFTETWSLTSMKHQLRMKITIMLKR